MGQEQKELTDSHFALGFWQETRVLSTPPPPPGGILSPRDWLESSILKP